MSIRLGASSRPQHAAPLPRRPVVASVHLLVDVTTFSDAPCKSPRVSTPAADPFAPDGVIPSGPYRGLRVDTSKARSLRLLSAAEAASYHPGRGDRLVANVRDGGEFCVARIPLGCIDKVLFQVEHIPHELPGSHAQLRFVLKPGAAMELTPHTGGGESRYLRDVIVTCDGTGPAGPHGPANPVVDGLEQYVVAYSMMSTRDKADIMVTDGQPHQVHQYELPLSDQQRQAVLDSALRLGSQHGMRQMFNLWAWQSLLAPCSQA